MKSEDLFKKTKVKEKISENKSAIEKNVLSLHDASAKLLKSLNKSDFEKQRMLANVFINAYLAAERLGIKDITKIIEDRIKELTE